MSKILSQAQAESVYAAMCSLNNVGARIDCFADKQFSAREMADGRIVVHPQNDSVFPFRSAEPETYANQAEFAEAYGLQRGFSGDAAALEQIARLGREGTRDGHIIRDAMVEIAEKALR